LMTLLTMYQVGTLTWLPVNSIQIYC